MSANVGCLSTQVEDAIQQAKIPLSILYPTQAPESTERFGPYAAELARDAEPVGENLPLVVISHGNGGSPWAYRDLAKHLVRSGFVVPEHIGNSRSDNSLSGTATNLENRPRHVSLVLDAIEGDTLLKGHIRQNYCGIAGHSIGAYTALAAAGGKPWSAPHENADGEAHPVCVKPDPRIRSLVLLMPATFWFIQGSLQDVKIPILIRTGEKDTITTATHANTVMQGVFDPQHVEHEMIAGAGHFSAMSRFPAEMTRADFLPSQDPPGFDREASQPALFSDITKFFHRTLAAA